MSASVNQDFTRILAYFDGILVDLNRVATNSLGVGLLVVVQIGYALLGLLVNCPLIEREMLKFNMLFKRNVANISLILLGY